MRFRSALLAGLLAGGAAYVPGARAQEGPGGRDVSAGSDAPRVRDLREEFGLGTPQPPQGPGCADGLALGCATATDPLDEATPYALSTWLPASHLVRLPVGDATHDAVAAFALGASRDGAGPRFGGATGLDNRWTIDGAPADSVRTGGVDTRVPLVFLSGLWISAGGFSARDRASIGGTIDARLLRGTAGHELSTGAWLHLARADRERPIAGYVVRRLSRDPGPDATVSLVATGPVGPLGARLGGTAWYAAGIAPRLGASELRWRAGRLVDADNDGEADGSPGEPVVATVEDTSARTLDAFVPVMARLGLDRGAQRIELSLIGAVQRDARFLAGATLPAAGVERTALTGDAIATWRGAWPRTRARAQLSWHRSDRREAARDGAVAGIPQLLSGFVPASLPEDPVLAAACDDASPDDPAPRIRNCPVGVLFASGGPGTLVDAVGDRPTISADVAHRLGEHVARAGATFEDTRLVTTTSFTGNEQLLTLFPGQLDRRRLYAGSCSDEPDGPCDVVSGSQLSYRTVYAAAYAEDTFSPRPGIAVDGGLRWELMWVGSAMRFSHQLAPRAGVAWDVLGGGRSRLWASYGRTFAMLPAGLGATVIQRDATVDDFEIGGVTARVRDPGTAFRVAADVRSIAQDEVTLGGQIALIGAVRLAVWAQGRFIGHGLETTADGLDNPGGREVAATRESEMVAGQLELAQERTAIRAGVMWGRTVGTWAGAFDPRQGATLLHSPDWNQDATNLHGRLPSDPGSRAFVEAERRGALGAAQVAVATRLTVGSGRPRNVLADGANGLVHLLPRGSAGRDPVIAEANLRLWARWRGVAMTLDVFNVFDRRAVTNLDEVYSDDAVRPIQGGSASDLVFLKNESGAPATRRPAFQLPTAFQSPLAISLGVHKAF